MRDRALGASKQYRHEATIKFTVNIIVVIVDLGLTLIAMMA